MLIYNNLLLTDAEIPDSSIGFLYKITHIPSGKWYIGRKMLSVAATKTVKGKKKKIRKESDWRSYWSSSKHIHQLVESEGESSLKKEVLLFVDTKACLTLGEEYLLHVSGALFDPNCLNENIRSRIYRTWFKKTPNFFKHLSSVKV